MAPEDFEQTRRGDCDDFALWTWRQLLGLGYNARFVVGSAGRYGTGHAWVTFADGDKTFLVEALLARAGATFPRLSVLRYRPIVSVEISGTRIRFFEHSRRALDPPFRVVAPLVPEWLLFRLRTLPRSLIRPFFSLAGGVAPARIRAIFTTASPAALIVEGAARESLKFPPRIKFM